MAPVGSEIYTHYFKFPFPYSCFSNRDRWEGVHIHGEDKVIQCVLRNMLIGSDHCVTCMKDFQLTNIISCHMVYIHL
jgi:hypothetical protein